MNRIVNDLLLLASAEQPDFVRPERLRLQDLLSTIHRKVTALGDRDWVLELPEDATVVGDAQRLNQAMVQLADNAFRHTSDGDRIRIGAAVEDGRVRLWVHDSGSGVPPQDTERIFRRFSRGSVRQPQGGAGLGLSIVQAIAVAHRGHARLAPANGVGARFEIVIPVTETSPSRPSVST